jgi:RimJ/RimL family protein N-acetyltransferase
MGVNGHSVPNRMGWRVESNDGIGYWVADELEFGFHAGRSTAIGLVKDDEIVAGVVYEGWNRRSITAHIVIKGRMTPSFLAAIFDYPFNVCGVEKIIAPVEIENVKSAKLVENMGFIPEARLADCHPNGDIVLYTMKRDDCRFLEDRYGQKNSKSTRSS